MALFIHTLSRLFEVDDLLQSLCFLFLNRNFAPPATDAGHFIALLLCSCLTTRIDQWIHCHVKSHQGEPVGRRKPPPGRPLAISLVRAKSRNATEHTSSSSSLQPLFLHGRACPGQRRFQDCRISCIMVKLSFCDAQMRLSLVL